VPHGGPSNPGADGVSSWLSGTARDVVQARDITGGIHIHPADASSAVPRPRQLPAAASVFVGREREFALLRGWALAETVAKGMLLIAGTAGVGKTSLAVGFAHRVREKFPDGQLFVNLRGYDPGSPLVPSAALERFLHALGVPPASIPGDLEERAELYRTLLADRRILIVLDNAVTAGQVRPLLPGGAECLVLITTRGRLSGLTAREGAHRITLGLLDRQEAVALFDAATTTYRDPDPPEQVAELVDLCARLPLALRIVAERAAVRPMMPLRDLIADLRSESSLWSVLSVEDSVDADAVRSVFAWSYRALPAPAAKAFRRLGLHPGPEFGSGVAAALVGDDERRARGLVDLLVGAHLLEQTGPDRYQFHDLLRAYALSQVASDESPEDRAAALKRAIEWYLHTAYAAVAATQSLVPSVVLEPPDPDLQIPAFESPAEAMSWYASERANLAVAVQSAADAGLFALAWQLPAVLFPLHDAYGVLTDWSQTARQGLEAARADGDETGQAALLHSLGAAYRAARDLERAEASYDEALALYTSVGDWSGVLRTANALGLCHLRRRHLDPAVAMFEKTLALAEQHGDLAWYGVAHDNLATVYDVMGLPELAAEHAEKALEHYRAARADAYTLIDPYLALARTSREAGDLVQAGAHLAAASEIMESGIVFQTLSYAILREHADQELALGHYEQALEENSRSAALARDLGDRLREVFAIDAVGQALLALGRAEEAVDFHRTAITAGAPHLLNSFERAMVLRHLATALEQTGQVDKAQSAREEAAMLLDEFTDPRARAQREEL
jgi:tetratricopeptide (TPR) repeat protein